MPSLPNSAYFSALILDRTLFDASVVPAVYVSLHSGDSGADGGNELVGYARQAVTLVRVGSAAAVNANALEFDDLPHGEVSHFGVWDAREDGNYLTGGPLPRAQRVTQDNQALRWREAEWSLRIGG